VVPNFDASKLIFKGPPLTKELSVAVQDKLYLSVDYLQDQVELLAKCFELLKVPMKTLIIKFNIMQD